MNVETDLRTYLTTSSGFAISGCTPSATYVGPVRKVGGTVPADATFIQVFGGLMPQGFQDGRNQTDRATDVQIRVRGRKDAYLQTFARAEAAWRAVNRAELSLAASSGVQYYRVQPLQSAPIYIGQDDQEHDEFTVNVRCHSLT
jgi:hypothetical protein